jgi:multisubunit Na+/H+ antiporter MnhC subunit
MLDFIEDMQEFCWICRRHYRHEERERHRHRKVRSLYIIQKGAFPMAINGVPVGGTGTFAATTVPAGSVLPTGVVPVWSSSDVTTATVASPNPDATGLTTVVTGIKTGTITLTVSATLPDNSVAQGSAVVPINAGEVKSFTINQTA